MRAVLSRARHVINFEGARSHYFKTAETLIINVIFTLSRCVLRSRNRKSSLATLSSLDYGLCLVA